MRFMLLQNYGEVESGCAAHERVDAGGHPGPHRVPARPERGAARARRTGRRPGTGRARRRRSSSCRDGIGAPVVTDGPFPESKELLAGYRMIDVETAERAHRDRGAGPRPLPGSDGRADPPADRGARGDGRPRPRGVSAGRARHRGPAARARAAGPRRRRPPLRRLRRRGGRGAGGADRRRRRVAGRRRARQPARLARARGVAPADRRATAATTPAAAARRSGGVVVDRPTPRPAPDDDDTLRPDVHVLPPVAHARRRRSRSRCGRSAD